MKQNHNSFFYFNGKFFPSQDSILETILASEGVFETLRYDKQGISFLKDHLERLFEGEKEKGLSSSSLEYEKIILQLIAKNNLQDEMLRVRIRSTQAGVSVSAEKYLPLPKQVYRDGVRLTIAEHPLKEGTAWIKHNKREAYNTLYTEAIRKGFDECLLLHDGFVQECCTSNVIVWTGEKILLPPRNGQRLVGVTEQQILKRIEVPVCEEKIKWPLSSEYEVFISGSLKGLLPVKEIAGQAYPVRKESPLHALVSVFSPYSS